MVAAKPKTRRKQRQFNFRLTEAEYRLIREAADRYPPSTWARVELLRLAERTVALRRKGKEGGEQE